MSISHLKNLFNHLLGDWTLERHIQTPDGNGTFSGQCAFTAMNDGRLLCNETGLLNINGNITEATRSYIYAYENDRIIIFYNDPHRKDEILHELTFHKQDNDYVATHCHLCGQDTYHLTFTMLSDTSIHMNYVIKGPHKDYAMQSTLIRQNSPSI